MTQQASFHDMNHNSTNNPNNNVTENLPYLPTVCVEEYSYTLPEERIAAYPLAERDASKLLVADANSVITDANGAEHCTIEHKTFREIVGLIPKQSLLVMNDSRVIAARLLMKKPTGGKVEVLCLQALAPSHDPAMVMQSTGFCHWKCMIGGRNVRQDDVLVIDDEEYAASPLHLQGRVLEKSGAEGIVEFRWTPAQEPFVACLDAFGHVPLPPYIKRVDEDADKVRYQTVYAEHNGSVAAPTAGLHFTPQILSKLVEKGVKLERVTLHVGAGTFRPMQGAEAKDHTMHEERIYVSRPMLSNLAEQVRKRQDGGGHNVVAVGTTSMRTLESLYWFGVRLIQNDGTARRDKELLLKQWDAFRLTHAASGNLPSPGIALYSVYSWMLEHSLDVISGETQLMIVPGYEFMICDALITNFHQPQSTLILLVAAFLSNSTTHTLWRDVYDAALANNYRFLSYGDSSLLVRKR